MPPALHPPPPVPIPLVRCLVALVLLGTFLPGLLVGIGELVSGFAHLHYSSARPVNGTLDLVRQAVIDQVSWGTLRRGLGRNGAPAMIVALAILFLRGRGPLQTFFRRVR